MNTNPLDENKKTSGFFLAFFSALSLAMIIELCGGLVLFATFPLFMGKSWWSERFDPLLLASPLVFAFVVILKLGRKPDYRSDGSLLGLVVGYILALPVALIVLFILFINFGGGLHLGDKG